MFTLFSLSLRANLTQNTPQSQILGDFDCYHTFDEIPLEENLALASKYYGLTPRVSYSVFQETMDSNDLPNASDVDMALYQTF